MKINIRKDRMNKYERWQAMFNHQVPDRMPFFSFGMGFTALHSGLSIADAYSSPEKVVDATTKTAEEFGWQDLPMIAMAAVGAWELGGEVKMPSGEWAQAPAVVRRPIESEEDVDKVKLPADISKAGIFPVAFETARLQLGRGIPVIQGFSTVPYYFAANGAGVDTICKWMRKKPDLVHKMQEKFIPLSIQLIESWLNLLGPERLLLWIAGAAAVSNQLISAQQFEEFFLPYTKRVYIAAHERGLRQLFLHICGEQNANLPYWAQLPFGDHAFLSFGHEVDLEVAADYFPNAVIIGNIEPAIIQVGSEEEAYEATRKVIEKGKRIGPTRFMLAPG